MSIEYPDEYSSRARARVEAERLRAIRDLERDWSEPPVSGFTETRSDLCAFYAYIVRVLRTFAHEACELGKQGTWTADRIRSEVDEFLRRFTEETYRERGYDRKGKKLQEMVYPNGKANAGG